MRAIFEALGVQDIVAKSVGTSNPHNMIKATFAALGHVTSPRAVRGSSRQEGGRHSRPAARGKRERTPDGRTKTVTVVQTGSPIGRRADQEATLKGSG